MTKAEQAAFRRAEKARREHGAFMLRTGNVYRHQTERLRKMSGQVDAKLPYSLEDFRTWFQDSLDRGCHYTGERLRLKTTAVDHRQPINRGGSWALSNLALCSYAANFQKGALSEDEYGQLTTFLAKLAPEASRDIRQRLGAGAKMLRMTA